MKFHQGWCVQSCAKKSLSRAYPPHPICLDVCCPGEGYPSHAEECENCVAQTTVTPSNPSPDVGMALQCKSWWGFSKSHLLCWRKSFAGSPDDWLVTRWSWERKVVVPRAGLWTPAPTIPELQTPRGSVHGVTVGIWVLLPLGASRVSWKCPTTPRGRRKCKVLQKERVNFFAQFSRGPAACWLWVFLPSD